MKRILGIIGIILVLSAMCAGLVGCISPTAFKISITSPEKNSTVNENPVTVTGVVSGYTRGEAVYGGQTIRIVPEVAVNGVKAEVAEDGTFSVDIELAEGKNFIEAVAMLNNLTVKDKIKVNCTAPLHPLTVEITAPEDGAELSESLVTVEGTVSDAEAAVTVNDEAVEVAEDGTFSAEVELSEGENTITAIATLGEKEVEASITVTYTVPVPPLAIEITAPEDGAEFSENLVTVNGTVSKAEAAVTVNGVAVEVAEDGTFSAEVELSEGENTITAIAVLDEEEAEASITVTYTAPAPVLAVEIVSPEDGSILTVSPLEIKGFVSYAEATVTVNDKAVEVAEDGFFSTHIELVDGVNVITVNAVLNELTAEDSITITYTEPEPPLTVEITAPEDGAEFSENLVTVEGTVSKAEAAVTVNGVAVEVAEDGTFSAEVELSEGENTITAIATLSEEEVEASITVTYTVPVPPLAIEITAPEDGAEFTESLVTVNGTVSKAEAAVTVNGVAVEVAEDGTFSAEVELSEGENTITAIAVLDEEEAQTSITVTYTILEVPLSLEVSTNPLTVTGRVSDPAAIVTVNGVEAEVAEDGRFTAQVELVEGENIITITAMLDGKETSHSFVVTYNPSPDSEA